MRKLGEDGDEYGSFSVPAIAGDVAQIERARDRGPIGRLVDLRQGLVAPGTTTSFSTCREASDRGAQVTLLPTGAVVINSYSAVVAGTCGASGDVPGPLKLDDGQGLRDAAPEADLPAWSAGAGPSAGGVYFLGAGGQPSRVQTSGAAVSVAWTADPELAWQPQSFPAPTSRVKSRFLAATGSASFALQSRNKPGGPQASLRLTIDQRPVDDGPHRFVLAKLVPGSSHEVKPLASADNMLLLTARFADAPTQLRVRLYRPGQPGVLPSPLVDLPASHTPASPSNAAVTTDGFAALAFSDRIERWHTARRANGVLGQIKTTTPAEHPRDLSAPPYGRILYFTDDTGTHSIPMNP